MKVIVLDCGFNGLAVIQSLGRKGVEIHAVDQKRTVGTFSKYVKRFTSIELNQDEGLILKKLNGLNCGSKILLMPTSDRWVDLLSRNRHLLHRLYLICAPEKHTVELLLNKYNFGLWCEKYGFNSPKVYKDHSCLSFPVAFKTNTRGVKKVTNIESSLRFKTVNSNNHLSELLIQANSNNIDYYFQEIIRGNSASMYTIGVYAREGEIFGLFFGKKVRGFPAKFGDCVVGKSLHVEKWVRQLAKQIIKQLNYTGIAEIELMKDNISGRYYIIEINPRSWSWVGITGFSGVDIPWIAYSDIVSPNSLQYAENSKFNVRYSKVISDFLNVNFRYNKTDGEEFTLTLWLWVKEYLNNKTYFAEFQKDDFFVSIFIVMQHMYSFLRSIIYHR